MRIIAPGILDARKDSDEKLDPEEAKHIANSICETLAHAGHQIVPAGKD